MPRKQRFKPSRKPPQPTMPASNTDERQEIHPDDVEIESNAPARGAPAQDESAIEKPRT